MRNQNIHLYKTYILCSDAMKPGCIEGWRNPGNRVYRENIMLGNPSEPLYIKGMLGNPGELWFIEEMVDDPRKTKFLKRI